MESDGWVSVYWTDEYRRWAEENTEVGDDLLIYFRDDGGTL